MGNKDIFKHCKIKYNVLLFACTPLSEKPKAWFENLLELTVKYMERLRERERSH